MSQLKTVSDLLKRDGEKPVPGLYAVATPLGNLEDFTLRGLLTLHHADLIACEDTRITGKLLERIGADKKKLIPCHNFNETEAAAKIIAAVTQGFSVALVSDAGTPLISDPGYRVIAAMREANLPVFVIPGVSAPVAAACVSGLPTDRLYFLGFPPKTSGKRQKLFAQIKNQDTSFVFFERAERVGNLLKELDQIFPNAEYCIAREITKKFETFYRGKAKVLCDVIEQANHFKGEVTLMVSPALPDEKTALEEYDDDAILNLLAEKLSAGEKLKAASEAVANLTGRSKKEIYQLGALHNNKQEGGV